MTILYSNGCSYTANYDLERDQRYPVLIGQQLGWEVIDRAMPGSCNDRIIRCTIRDCIELLKRQEPITAMIQLTHPYRTEHSVNFDEHSRWKRWNDEFFESIKPMENLPSEVAQYMNLHMIVNDQPGLIIKLMSSLIGLTGFFRQHQIKYLIFNGPNDLNQFVPDNFYHYLEKDPGIVDLKNFNMLNVTGQQKHPDPTGMITIADYFVSHYPDLLS